MKKIIIFYCLLAFCLCHADVIFVPGWMSEQVPTEKYTTELQQIYPEKHISVRQWKSNVQWTAAIAAADAFAPELAQDIINKTEKEREEIILIGHSLGCRIIVKTAEILASKNVKIKQFIMLGGALDMDYDLTPVVKASYQTNINVFSRNDSVLKYAYNNAQGKFAIGFAGIEKMPSEKFIQYNFTTTEPIIANTSKLTFWMECVNHFAQKYILELSEISSGKKSPYTPSYDYSKITIKKSALAVPDNWVIPPVIGMTVIDSYADWTLTSVTVKWSQKDKHGNVQEHSKKIYFIIDHYGRIFSWNLLKMPLQKRFNNIKKEIVKIK